MSKLASKVIAQAKAWIGKKEADGSFKTIIDTYNAHTPLARGYKVQYSDEWCATFVSAVAIKCGYTDIIPTECSCERMIALMKNKGIWKENENRVPSTGDIIFYDWDDNGTGDCKGTADHVGIVEKVSDNTITVIEGNKGEAVARRTIAVNGRYIRGYGVPKYDTEKKSEVTVVKKKTKKQTEATASAKAFDKTLAGTYKTTDSLYLRNDAGKSNKALTLMPKGTQAQCYGYYTSVGKTKWLYVQTTINGTKYTGFCSSVFLKKA